LELFEELGVVFEHRGDDTFECSVVLDTGVLAIGVLLRVLVGRVRRDLRWDYIHDALLDGFRIVEEPAELVVERLDDVRELVHLRLGLVSAPGHAPRLDLRLGIGQSDGHRGLLLGAVAVHVDGFEDAFREILFNGRRQLRDEEIQEDREFLPVLHAIREDGRIRELLPVSAFSIIKATWVN